MIPSHFEGSVDFICVSRWLVGPKIWTFYYHCGLQLPQREEAKFFHVGHFAICLN